MGWYIQAIHQILATHDRFPETILLAQIVRNQVCLLLYCQEESIDGTLLDSPPAFREGGREEGWERGKERGREGERKEVRVYT